MNRSIFKFNLAGLIVVIGLVGCASETPNLDKHFGDAVNAAKAQQTINPDASQNSKLEVGIDGQAANAAVDNYHKSFVQPPATTNVFNIGVGASGSSGK
jgi:hypothetical protein